MVRDVVTIFGVIAGFTYYAINVQNSRKMQKMQLEARQAQLYIQIFNYMLGPDFLRTLGSLEEFKDFEDFQRKHFTEAEARADVIRLAGFFEGLGLLGEQNLIDVNLMSRLMGGNLIGYWKRLGPIHDEWRAQHKDPYLWEYVEWLYNKVTIIREERQPAYLTE
jgi:hypothetical protein